MPAAPLPTSSPVWHTARDLLYTCSMLPPPAAPRPLAISAPAVEPPLPPSVETPAPTAMPPAEDQGLLHTEAAMVHMVRTYTLVAVSRAARPARVDGTLCERCGVSLEGCVAGVGM